MRFAHILQFLSAESERRRREHTSAMKIRHILNKPNITNTVLKNTSLLGDAQDLTIMV